MAVSYRLPIRRTTRQIVARGVKRDYPSAERTHRFHHGACKKNSPPDERSDRRIRQIPHPSNNQRELRTVLNTETIYPRTDKTVSGIWRVRQTSYPTNKQSNLSTGRVRETPHPTKEQTVSRTGCFRETPPAPNDERDSITGRVRETPHQPKTDTRTGRNTGRNTGRVRETPFHHPPTPPLDEPPAKR